MISLPFFFFLFWFIKSYRKFGLSIGTYILFLYTFTSLCSIGLDSMNLYASHSCPKTDIGIVSPLLYILLHSMCIYPFYKMGKINIQIGLSQSTNQLLHRIVSVYFGMFLVVLFVSFTKINEILFVANIAEVRNTQYTGDVEPFYAGTSGFLRYICAISSILSLSSLLMILVFGYYLVSSEKPIYTIMSLIASMSPLLISINIADRSRFMIWLFLMGFVYCLFFDYLSKKKRLYISICLGAIVAMLIAYFAIVTIARFEDRNGGALGGIIQYAGMPYINCCRFFNELDIPTSFTFFFPSYNTYITNGDRYFDIAFKLEQINRGQPFCVLPSFLGIVYSVTGIGGFLLFMIVYLYAANKIYTIYTAYCLNISQLIKFWIIAVIQVVGPVTYFYITEDVSLILWFLLAIYINHKIKPIQKKRKSL